MSELSGSHRENYLLILRRRFDVQNITRTALTIRNIVSRKFNITILLWKANYHKHLESNRNIANLKIILMLERRVFSMDSIIIVESKAWSLFPYELLRISLNYQIKCYFFCSHIFRMYLKHIGFLKLRELLIKKNNSFRKYKN